MTCCPTKREAAALASSSRFIAPTPFLLYKALIAAYFLFWCVRWPIVYTDVYLFLTYWSWYTGALYFVVSTATAFINMERGPLRYSVSDDTSPSWEEENLRASEANEKVSLCERVLLCLQMVTWNVSCVSSLVVLSVYWSSLYNGGPLSSVDINAHLFFAIIMLIDQFIIAAQHRLRDIWLVELFGLIYVIFDIVYYYESPTGDKVIYVILDWSRNRFEALGYCFGTLLVLIPLFTLLHYGVFRLREFVYGTCQKHVESSPTVLSNALLGVEGGSNHTRTRSSSTPPGNYIDV